MQKDTRKGVFTLYPENVVICYPERGHSTLNNLSPRKKKGGGNDGAKERKTVSTECTLHARSACCRSLRFLCRNIRSVEEGNAHPGRSDVLCQWTRHHGRIPSLLHAPLFQVRESSTDSSRNCRNYGNSKYRQGMGFQSCSSSSGNRQRRGSVQCDARILVFAYRMGSFQRSSQKKGRFQRSRSSHGRSLDCTTRGFSAQALSRAGHPLLRRRPYFDRISLG